MKKILKHLKKNWFRYGLETLVVIVGVLIAFALNNWNQEVKNRVQQQSYLKSLIVDLSKDTVVIQNILATHIEDSLRIATHQKKLTKENASLEELLRIYVNDWNPRIGALRSFNTNTVEAMVSTGNINLIDSEILNYLTHLKRLQKAYISSSVPFIEFYRNSGNPTVDAPSHWSVINQGPIFEQMIENADKIALAYKFNNRLTIKRQAYRNSIRNLNEIHSKTEELIDLIKEKIE